MYQLAKALRETPTVDGMNGAETASIPSAGPTITSERRAKRTHP